MTSLLAALPLFLVLDPLGNVLLFMKTLASYFARFFGEKEPITIERLPGILLITVAVQILRTVIADFVGKNL